MGQPITTPQMRKIWSLARQLGLDDDLLHAVVDSLTGKSSIRALNKYQAGIVIDELDRRHRAADRPGMASRAQIYKIRQLEKALGWDTNPDRLRGFIKKYGGVDDLRWLPRAKAWRIIEGLKKILARQGARQGEERDSGS
ncbi:MAG: regulatory protein GemA [Bacillota bacterium]|nr:regulatory protein GemA [Bacillota bacterium]